MLFVIVGTLAAGAFVRLDAEAQDEIAPLVAEGAAFQVPAGGAVGVATPAVSSADPVMSATSRRAALAAGGATLASLALPRSASADEEEDDAIARIAAKNMASLKAEKERQRAKLEARALKGKTEEQENDEAKEAAKRNILAIAGGGTLASTAFFYKNLQRLFIKITSGGDDDGYGTIPANGKAPRGKAPAKKAPARGRRGKQEEPEPEPKKGGFFR